MHYYIVSRIKEGQREYLQTLKSGEEVWDSKLVGAKNYATKEAAEVACSAVRTHRSERYEVITV